MPVVPTWSTTSLSSVHETVKYMGIWKRVILDICIIISWNTLQLDISAGYCVCVCQIVTYWATLQEMGWNNLQRLIGVDHLAHLPDGEGVVDVHPVQLLLVLQEQKRRLFPLIVPANPDNRGQKGVKWWNVCTALELQLTLANTRGKSGRFGFLPAAGKRNHCRRDWNPKQALNFSHMEVWTENGQGLFLLTFFWKTKRDPNRRCSRKSFDRPVGAQSG